MNIENKWFYEKLKNEYNNNNGKQELWDILGGFLAFNYNYFSKINKYNTKDDYKITKDLLDDNISVKLAVEKMIKEILKSFLNRLSDENLLNFDLIDSRIVYNKALRERRDNDLGNKNFADFIWYIKDYDLAIIKLTSMIMMDINMVNLKFLGIKYKRKGEIIYRNSPFRLAELNLLLSNAKSNKEVTKQPILTVISLDE